MTVLAVVVRSQVRCDQCLSAYIHAGSVDCVVTSPPYFGLRSYLPEDHPDKAAEYGTEETPAEFVANLVATFAEIRRTLANDGTVWMNLGDSYSQTSTAAGVAASPGAQPLHSRTTDGSCATRSSGTSRTPWPSPSPTGCRRGTRCCSCSASHAGTAVPGQEYRQHRVERRDPATYGAASGTNLQPTGVRHTAVHSRGKNPAPSPRPWPTAKRHIELPENGLQASWEGRVWLNPPYSFMAWAWLTKLADHGKGTSLVFARTETAGFVATVWERATAILFLHGRLHFHHPDGQRAPANSGAPSCLVAYGQYDAERLRTCELRGTFLQLGGAS